MAFRDSQGAVGDPPISVSRPPDGWARLMIDRELAARGRPGIALTHLGRLAIIGTDGILYRRYHIERVACLGIDLRQQLR
jgi:hypothetical protein